MTIHQTFQLLLVEDNPGDADLAQERLSSVPDYTFKLTCVSRLDDAIGVLSEGGIDAVILDLSLPDSQGIDTLRRLRRAREDVAIVVMSGGMSEDLRGLVMREGAQDFIGKNEAPALLLARIMPSALERHRAQEQHRQIEQLVELMPDSVIVTDTDGRVQFANAAAVALFDRSRKDFIGTPFDYPIIDGEATQIEIVRTDTILTAEMRVARCKWERAPAYLVSIRDMTEQKRLSELLLQSQKLEAVGLLAGGLAHDYNNILLVVLFHAEFLRAELDHTERYRKTIGEILSAVERAKSLTSQLLAFSRRQPVVPEVLDLNEVVDSITNLIKRILPESIELTKTSQYGLWPVLADPGQIEQLVANLVVNAKDAMPSGGQLIVKLENVSLEQPTAHLPFGDFCSLTVQDTGEGMAPETIGRIFEPFFTTKAAGRGTGLGLATCYGIVQQAHGDISVTSQLGQGTKFTILLPRAHGTPQTQAKPVAAPQRRTGTGTVLVVEDNAFVRESVQRILKDSGYEVLIATNGEAALQLIEHYPHPIDLVLTDVVMPRLGGYALAEKLKLSHPDIKVLLTTGYAEEVLSNDGLLDAGYQVIFKPYHPQDLIVRIGDLLDSRPPGDGRALN